MEVILERRKEIKKAVNEAVKNRPVKTGIQYSEVTVPPVSPERVVSGQTTNQDIAEVAAEIAFTENVPPGEKRRMTPQEIEDFNERLKNIVESSKSFQEGVASSMGSDLGKSVGEITSGQGITSRGLLGSSGRPMSGDLRPLEEEKTNLLAPIIPSLNAIERNMITIVDLMTDQLQLEKTAAEQKRTSSENLQRELKESGMEEKGEDLFSRAKNVIGNVVNNRARSLLRIIGGIIETSLALFAVDFLKFLLDNRDLFIKERNEEGVATGVIKNFGRWGKALADLYGVIKKFTPVDLIEKMTFGIANILRMNETFDNFITTSENMISGMITQLANGLMDTVKSLDPTAPKAKEAEVEVVNEDGTVEKVRLNNRDVENSPTLPDDMLMETGNLSYMRQQSSTPSQGPTSLRNGVAPTSGMPVLPDIDPSTDRKGKTKVQPEKDKTKVQPKKGYSMGGLITPTSGYPSGGQIDSRMVAVQPGEMIMSKKAVEHYGASSLMNMNRSAMSSSSKKPITEKMMMMPSVSGYSKRPIIEKIMMPSVSGSSKKPITEKMMMPSVRSSKTYNIDLSSSNSSYSDNLSLAGDAITNILQANQINSNVTVPSIGPRRSRVSVVPIQGGGTAGSAPRSGTGTPGTNTPFISAQDPTDTNRGVIKRIYDIGN
jgi:hypothetical protein